jgi:uncharacterized membrane protein
MNTLGKLFLKGLAVVIPVALTLAILWWLAKSAEQLLGGLLIRFLPEGWYLPGMGLAAALLTTILIGLLSQLLLFRRLFSLGENVLHSLPGVKTIYAAIKDFIDYFNPDSQQAMSKVVMVRIPGQEFEQIGFVTREDFRPLSLQTTVQDPVAVYLPMSYQIGGYTLILPRACIRPTGMSFEEGMRLVLTGAITRKPQDRPPLS